MAATRSKPGRVFLAVLLCVLGTFSIVNLAGGPDPLDDWWSVIFGVLLLSWFVPELRTDEGEARWIRGALWIGVVGAVGMIAFALAEMLF